MSVSSVTIVGAFDAVGAVLVVALIIAPAATAYLLTDDLRIMLVLSCCFGVFAAISGYWMANLLDASIAGSITTMLGLAFLLVYLFAPSSGVLSGLARQRRQRLEVALLVFLLHLQNHDEPEERHVKHLQEHINWQKVQSERVLDLATKNNFIELNNGVVNLTKKGQQFTEEALSYIVINKETAIEDLKDQFFLFRG
jgi:manganese/zinc/iron transport system permease protein